MWSPEENGFKLRFTMDELVSSVNNFILQQGQDDVMELGKVQDGGYKLRCKKSIDQISVFSIVVSALSWKWICV